MSGCVVFWAEPTESSRSCETGPVFTLSKGRGRFGRLRPKSVRGLPGNQLPDRSELPALSLTPNPFPLDSHFSQLTPSSPPFVVSRPGVPGRPCRTTPRMQHPTLRPSALPASPAGTQHPHQSQHTKATPTSQPLQAHLPVPSHSSLLSAHSFLTPVRGEPPWSLSEGRVEPQSPQHPTHPRSPVGRRGESRTRPSSARAFIPVCGPVSDRPLRHPTHQQPTPLMSSSPRPSRARPHL